METEQREYLHTLYQAHGNLVYASVCAQLAEPAHTAGPWRVYIASKHMGKLEVVYGSLLHIMDEAVRPLFQVRELLQELGNALPDDLRSSVEVSVVDGTVTHALPEGPHTDALLHQQEQALKDALLLSATHVRTLLEDFDGVGNIRIAIYDYEGRLAGDVPLSRVFHTLAHYRYCMVSGEFVHDIFSREGQLGDSSLTGTKVRIEDLFQAVLGFISEIKIRRFVGVLRARFHSLSADSEPSDIIFAVQNLQSVWQIIRDRTSEGSPLPGFLSYILGRFVTEKLNSEAPEWATRADVQVAWSRFTFRIADDLGRQLVEVRFGVGDKTEMLKLTWDEFFTELVRFHGNESIVSYETLEERYKALNDPMLPPPASP